MNFFLDFTEKQRCDFMDKSGHRLGTGIGLSWDLKYAGLMVSQTEAQLILKLKKRKVF
jgi:hypothetical protein